MFWTSPVPKENVLLVNSSEKFAGVGETLRGAALVGLDAEWRPSHLAKELHTPPRISILQVACRMREQLPEAPRGATWRELREDDSGAAAPAPGAASHADEAWDPLSTAVDPIPGAHGLTNRSPSETHQCCPQATVPSTVSSSGSASSSSHVNGDQASSPPLQDKKPQQKKPVASNKAKRRKAKGRPAARKEGVAGPMKEVVLILDMIQLDPHLVLPALASLFNDPAVLKLGFSFRDDLRMIQASYAPSATLSQCLQVSLVHSKASPVPRPLRTYARLSRLLENIRSIRPLELMLASQDCLRSLQHAEGRTCLWTSLCMHIPRATHC